MTSCDSNFSHGMHRRMILSIAIVAITLIVELIGGSLSNSLALLSDAGHVFTDLVALSLSCVAYKLTTKKADKKRSYGYHRLQVMAAFVNGVSLFVVAILIVFEACKRFINPVDVQWQLMMLVALFGLGTNLLVFGIMHRKHEDDINIKSAVLHVIADLLGSLAAILSSIGIMLSGWHIIDPLLSVGVSAIMLYSAWKVIKYSSNILMEGKPDHLDVEEIKQQIKLIEPAVVDVHHVHLWMLTAGYTIMTMHIRVAGEPQTGGGFVHFRRAIKAMLQEKFSIAHVTVEIEREECSDVC